MKGLGLSIAIFVSDRHRGIAKWIRENCASTKHYFDIWHIARSITKKLLSASKEKGCEIIKDWMKGIRRHVYWCATSTKDGFEALILAKWTSFMRHVANKHSDHPDPLYKQCHHGDLEPRKWIKIGRFFLTYMYGSHISLSEESQTNITCNLMVVTVSTYSLKTQGCTRLIRQWILQM